MSTSIRPYYEISGSAATKYYYLGSQRVALRSSVGVRYLFGDHLGSTSVSADVSGGSVTKQLYKAFGETRFTSGSLPTKYQYTGQYSNMGDFGLMFYNARWFDPVLGRFSSADTIVPGASNPAAWDRYAGMLNNPLRYRDPSGHEACDEDGNCYNAQGWYRAPGYYRLSTEDTWKMMILGKFGIKMQDGEKIKWSNTNLETAFIGLNMVDKKLNGHLKQMVRGTTFSMASQGQCSGNNGPYNCYHGITNSTGVIFYSSSVSLRIPLINFIHETGHLLDMVPTTAKEFSGQLKADRGYAPNNPNWTRDGYVDSTLLVDQSGEPVQALPMGEDYDTYEYWADAFANYLTDNIDVSQPAGQEMYNFVDGSLAPYR